LALTPDGEEAPEFDFDAALAAKGLVPDETTQEEVTTEASAEESTTPDERPRDEQGRFIAQQPTEAAPEESGESLIAGKFKSVEELAAAYQELESFKGRQGSELGELRREIQELRESQQTPQQQEQYVPVSNELVSQIDELADVNPQQAAVWSLANQPLLYDRVMETWFENDPRGASRFEMALMRAELEAEVKEQIAPIQAPIQQQTAEAQFAQAWASVTKKFPDMNGEAVLEAAQAAPEIAEALQHGDVATKERMIENLYWLAKGRQADSVTATTAAAVAESAAQVVQQKLEAQVVSGSSAATRGDTVDPITAWKQRLLAESSTSIFENTTSE
jgi:hypothetical protein